MHRPLGTATLLATLTLPLGATALAGSAEETFDRLIDKVAPAASSLFIKFKPRLACACFDSSPPAPGVVVTDNGGRIRCGLPAFDGSGNVFSFSFCNDYEVLGR